MPILLPWPQLSFDSAPHDPNRKTQFFVDSTSGAPDSVTQLDEKSLVLWLMQTEPVRAFILRELGRQDSAFHATELVDPFYGSGEGDIDFLVCDRLDPGAAAAFECKRIKVEEVDEKNDRMNKLSGITTAVRQVNRLYEKCGFFETYLAVLIEVECSKQFESNIPCRGLRPDSTHDFGSGNTQRATLNFPGYKHLNQKIGIIIIEVAQPSKKSVNRMANLRLLRYHPATPRFQSAQTTRQISALIEKANRSGISGSDSADWEAAPPGTVELHIGDGADALAVGRSPAGPEAAPASATTFFNLRSWKVVTRRSPR